VLSASYLLSKSKSTRQSANLARQIPRNDKDEGFGLRLTGNEHFKPNNWIPIPVKIVLYD